MKSIRTNPTDGAPEGDERIRTAVPAPGADLAHVRDALRCVNAVMPNGRKQDEAWGTAIKGLNRLCELLEAQIERLMEDE